MRLCPGKNAPPAKSFETISKSTCDIYIKPRCFYVIAVSRDSPPPPSRRRGQSVSARVKRLNLTPQASLPIGAVRRLTRAEVGLRHQHSFQVIINAIHLEPRHETLPRYRLP